MKIVILGSNGMLGQMASIYFSQFYKVTVINNRYDLDTRLEFVKQLQSFGKCYIINCIGKIKQNFNNSSDYITINAVMPLDIYNSLTDNQYLVQPSTDCVFTGSKTEWYSVKDLPNAADNYGWSKRLGETGLLGKDRAYILRVSIIGPDRRGAEAKGLLSWFLNNPNGSVLKGFTNHFWNGITTLEWCKKVHSLVLDDFERKNVGKIIQLGTNSINTKYELLNIFQEIYNTNFIINEFESLERVNRALEPTVVSSDIQHLIEEQKRFFARSNL